MARLILVMALSMAIFGSVSAHFELADSRPSSGKPAVVAKVPKRFDQRASVAVGEGEACVVGEVGDKDGMNNRPFVYLTEGADHHVRWVKGLGIPEFYYEGRATHCVRKADALFVLVQLSTSSFQATNQGQLHVVKLNVDDGSVESDVRVSIPDAKRGYSAWSWDDDDLQLVDDGVRVRGLYRYSDLEDDVPFSVTLKM